jgi:Putative peptidoglycan-binding domain-containing protein
MSRAVPYIPEYITVHLGAPGTDAPNVTVPFIDYIKNVASSEVYPTWEISALRANILAIVSFALNRVYLDYYRSRGYDFDITSTTAYDQRFVNGRSTFDTIDRLVDDLFDDYLRRQGFIEPLAAKFCNGTTVTCDGLSQWGSQALARQGYDSVQILRTYYGDDVEIVQNVPSRELAPSYPGRALRLGDVGPDVARVQYAINRVSQNYPAIPQIPVVDGIFALPTEQAVRSFQTVFSLTSDGIIGPATWYELRRLFVAVTRLAELQSEGIRLDILEWEYPEVLQEGDTGIRVEQLQFLLEVLSQFIDQIPRVEINGFFDPGTKRAVDAFQQWAGLEQTGQVGDVTWNRIYDEYEGVRDVLIAQGELPALPGQFPGTDLTPGSRDGEVT